MCHTWSQFIYPANKRVRLPLSKTNPSWTLPSPMCVLNAKKGRQFKQLFSICCTYHIIPALLSFIHHQRQPSTTLDKTLTFYMRRPIVQSSIIVSQPPQEPTEATAAATATRILNNMTAHLNPRHRNVAVLFLSGISMVGCFLWWGSLKVGVLPSNHNDGNNNNNNKLQDKYSSGPPPALLFQSKGFADDDENEFTGDDDTYKHGERIRGSSSRGNGDKAKETQKKPSEQPPSSSTSSVGVSSKNSPAASTSSSSSSSESPQPNNYSWESQQRPKMVWLMSYPNSGTSYTMTMVGKATNRATASNYGREVTDPPTPNVPLYPGQWNGPFYRPNPRKPLPTDYILVKTHCGGTCICVGLYGYVCVRYICIC